MKPFSATVMNIVTATHAYSLYPRTTFHQRRGLIISTNGSSQDAGRQKYIDRGWDLFSELTVFEVTNPYSEFEAHSLRWVGDRRCLSVKLPPMELPFAPYPVTVNSWQMTYGWNCTVKIERESVDTDRFDFCVSQGAKLFRVLDRLEDLWTTAWDKCRLKRYDVTQSSELVLICYQGWMMSSLLLWKDITNAALQSAQLMLHWNGLKNRTCL